MSEFLIYQGPHWMDELDPGDLTERLKYAVFKAKYDSRYRPGDIVQRYEDGSCKEKTSPNSKMYIIKCPELTMEESKHMTDVLMDKTDPENPIIKKRRKYRIKLEDLSLGASGELSTDKKATISKTEFNNCLDTKKILSKLG